MMQSVEDTANEINVFAKGKDKLKSAMQSVRTISDFFNCFRKKDTQNEISSVKSIPENIEFTGQHTDIAFADREGGQFNQKIIDNIDNDELKLNVQRSFHEAMSDGYLNYDYDTCCYSLTQKGKEHINQRSFIEQFEKDQLYKATENKAQISLQGNSNDLNAFRYTDKLNLNQVMTSDPQTFKKVVAYFEECKKYGFVDISSDGIVTPTAKCNNFLAQNKEMNFNVTKINPQNAQDIYSRAQAMRTGVNSGKAAKSAATASKAAKATASAGKAAATAGASAATAGVAAAATTVIDLSKKGIEALKKAPNIHSQKINH